MRREADGLTGTKSTLKPMREGLRVLEDEKNLKIKAARMERGLSQTDLANAVGATRQTIGLIEAGRYNPSLKLCRAICKTLGKTLDDLFWE